MKNITLGETFTFANGSRAHTDIVNEVEEDQYEYRIRASRNLNGSVIYSDWSETVVGWASKQVTGSEDNEIHGSCYSNLSGYSVDIDGEWAVSGTINGEERINIYRMIDGGWSLYQTIVSPLSIEDADFGYSVAISDESLIVGAPLDKKALVYQFDGLEWNNPQVLTNSNGSRYGHSVDIHNDNCVVSDPTKSISPNSGEIQIYIKENNIWSLNLEFNYSNSQRFGYGLALSDDVMVASYTRISSPSFDLIAVFEKHNGNWRIKQNTSEAYSQISYTDNTSLTNDNLDLHNDYLAIGDYKYVGGVGQLIYAHIPNGVVTSGSKVHYIPPGYTGSPNFGKSVAIRRISSPTDDVTYIALGAPNSSTTNTSGVGKSYLLSDVSGSLEVLEEYQNTFETVEEETAESGGWSVSLSQTTMMIGTPYAGTISHGEVELP